MTPELKNAITLADRYIKANQFSHARAVLMPFKDKPEAAKRLRWLKLKLEQTDQQNLLKRRQRETGRRRLFLSLISGAVIVGAVVLVLLLRNSPVSAPPSANTATLPSELSPAPSAANTEPTLTAIDQGTLAPTVEAVFTEIVVTEDPAEIDVQASVRQQLMELPQINEIVVIDIDSSPDSTPIVYLEIMVNPGMIDNSTIEAIVDLLSTALNTTAYGNFEIILSDDTHVVDYTFNTQARTWQQTPLLYATPPTLIPR